MRLTLTVAGSADCLPCRFATFPFYRLCPMKFLLGCKLSYGSIYRLWQSILAIRASALRPCCRLLLIDLNRESFLIDGNKSQRRTANSPTHKINTNYLRKNFAFVKNNKKADKSRQFCIDFIRLWKTTEPLTIYTIIENYELSILLPARLLDICPDKLNVYLCLHFLVTTFPVVSFTHWDNVRTIFIIFIFRVGPQNMGTNFSFVLTSIY